MAGYPDEHQVASRNRYLSNQPGSIAEPEQAMVRDFEPDSPQSEHMHLVVDALRKPAQGYDMDYRVSNQPLENSYE